VVTTNPQAAAWYRRAQRAADPRWAAMALRLDRFYGRIDKRLKPPGALLAKGAPLSV